MTRRTVLLGRAGVQIASPFSDRGNVYAKSRTESNRCGIVGVLLDFLTDSREAL